MQRWREREKEEKENPEMKTNGRVEDRLVH